MESSIRDTTIGGNFVFMLQVKIGSLKKYFQKQKNNDRSEISHEFQSQYCTILLVTDSLLVVYTDHRFFDTSIRFDLFHPCVIVPFATCRLSFEYSTRTSTHNILVFVVEQC